MWGMVMSIIDVVKYNGNADVFAWKFPSEELSTWTQLIVNESQEAVLYKGGKALDIFPAGRYTLETANIPILNNIINLPFGGRSPFTAEVWFINKAFALDIKWGTPTPIQLQDPKYKVFIPLLSYGQFGIQICDSKVFLTKLVGSLPVFDKSSILDYFRGLFLTKIKDAISTYLVQKSVSVLEINAYLDELSDYLKKKLVNELKEYGIILVNFYVNDINVPEQDPAVKRLKDALAKRAEMDIVGYNYAQERSFNTLEGAATNPSSGQSGLMGAGVGLGMGVGLGGVFGNQMGGIAQNLNTKSQISCHNCKSQMDGDARFCSSCGYDTMQKNDTRDPSVIMCTKCGKPLDKNMKFCSSCGDKYNPCKFCGADLEDGATKCNACNNDVPKSCPKCSEITHNNMNFCTNCGESLTEKCSKCGNKINERCGFCSNCGNRL